MEHLRTLLRQLSWTKLLVYLVITVMMAQMVHQEQFGFTCSELLSGQYECSEPEIDNNTQSAKGCTDGQVKVDCKPAPGLMCDGALHNGSTIGFQKAIPCRNTNGYSYRTTLLLSIFLGMFGIDRIYLGYHALGLLKFCTMGLLFVGQFVDVILIATQVVGPADGSAYEIDFYAPKLIRISVDNETYYVPQDIL